jgi:hypothetical protein
MTGYTNRLGICIHRAEVFALPYEGLVDEEVERASERWSNWRGEFGVKRGPCSDMVTGDDDGGAFNHSIIWHT